MKNASYFADNSCYIDGIKWTCIGKNYKIVVLFLYYWRRWESVWGVCVIFKSKKKPFEMIYKVISFWRNGCVRVCGGGDSLPLICYNVDISVDIITFLINTALCKNHICKLIAWFTEILTSYCYQMVVLKQTPIPFENLHFDQNLNSFRWWSDPEGISCEHF